MNADAAPWVGLESYTFARGRVALFALLKAFGIQPGDEVLLQAFTCLAVPLPVIAIGARPVYVDIDPNSLNMDVESMRSRLTPNTKAVIVQHSFGMPADMDNLLHVARQHNLIVIEDCCHDVGAQYHGARLGTLGDGAFYSFEWGKPLVVGIGGLAVSQRPEVARTLRELHQASDRAPRLHTAMIHVQYVLHSLMRLTPGLYWIGRRVFRLMAERGLAIGTFGSKELQGSLTQDYSRRMPRSLTRRLDRAGARWGTVMRKRRELTSAYIEAIESLGVETTSRANVGIALRVPVLTSRKGDVLAAAKKHRVQLGDRYDTPVHPLTQPDWSVAGYVAGSCPIAEAMSQRVVTIPIDVGARQSQFDRTVTFLSAMKAEGYL